MRSIKNTYKAVNSPIEDLITYRAMPTHEVNYIDPFLFLNHHGPQVYPPHNDGLPFGPHPHRGFETLTFIFDGDVMHRDSGGGKDTIRAGGIQWMTAGRGLIHTEVSSSEFKEKGGKVELIQLWFNLPGRLKMTPPNYVGLQKDKIPAISTDNDKVTINAISGNWADNKGPVQSITDISIASIEMKQGSVFSKSVDSSQNILFYVVRGAVKVNGTTAAKLHLVDFTNDAEEVQIEALEDSLILFGHAKPYNEPIVAQGPFVMNTQTEIMQAMRDYQMGKMGVWIDED
jgi:redox-sensitive bicupin YhaK (pirin superfamily)